MRRFIASMSASFFRLSRRLKSVCYHYPKKQSGASTRWFIPTVALPRTSDAHADRIKLQHPIDLGRKRDCSRRGV